MSTRIAMIAAAALIGAAASHSASAQAEIAFDRSALVDPAAVEQLYQDVTRAAERACRRENDRLSVLGPTARRRAVERCVTETVDAAIRAADAPALLARHRDGEHLPPATLLAARQ